MPSQGGPSACDSERLSRRDSGHRRLCPADAQQLRRVATGEELEAKAGAVLWVPADLERVEARGTSIRGSHLLHRGIGACYRGASTQRAISSCPSRGHLVVCWGKGELTARPKAMGGGQQPLEQRHEASLYLHPPALPTLLSRPGLEVGPALCVAAKCCDFVLLCPAGRVFLMSLSRRELSPPESSE